MNHFLSLFDRDRDQLLSMIERASQMKRSYPGGLLEGKRLAMIFEKPSLRTRLSFETGMVGLGGYAIYVAPNEVCLGERESIEDVARVMSRMVDAIMLRTFEHSIIERFAKHSSVPVINGLTEYNHPCQIMSSLLTVYERIGNKIENLKVAYIGDPNNVYNSWINAAAQIGFEVRIACPKQYQPKKEYFDYANSHKNGGKLSIHEDPHEAVKGVDLIYTDAWTSMGQESETEIRFNTFKDKYCIDMDLIKSSERADVLYSHCLPAHVGEEVSKDVHESALNIAFDEAENRMHMQRAIILDCLNL